MPSPDLSGYIDLTLYDKSAQDIYELGRNELLIRAPEYRETEGAIEVELLEVIAQMIAEAGIALNRLPGALTQILLLLFGIERYEGAEPTAAVMFTLSDDFGHVIDVGTRVRLDLGAEEPVVFSTTEVGQANPGESTITVAVLGDRFTDQANDVPAGTSVELLDSVFFVDSAALATSPTAGVEPETVPDWLNRGAALFARLTVTLGLAEQFTAAALENPLIFRAMTLDNWNPGWDPPPGLAAAPSGSGGSLVGGATYRYKVTAITAAGETLPCASIAAAIPAGPNTGSVVLTWAAPAARPGAGAITGYKVYRTVANGADATLGLVATLGVVLTYTSTGAGAPGAAPPTANGTGATTPGYVTTAVYGPSGFVADADKAALQADLDAQALANLGVSVVDVTVTAVNVDVTVLAAEGFTSAQVTEDITAALTDLLSTDTWPFDPVARRNVIISTVGSLASVAYVETLTTPAADVNLPGIAPLATLGTLNVTVDLP